VPVSASITDERVVQKTDIAKEDKEQPDEIAYKQLAAVQPNPELSYSSQTYDRILTSLNAFQTQYPKSTYLPEVKKLTDVFADEKKRVDAGEFKYEGSGSRRRKRRGVKSRLWRWSITTRCRSRRERGTW